MIDHGRAFQVTQDLSDADQLDVCPRDLFERMRDLDRDEVVDAIARHMEPGQIGALFARRDKIVEHYERLIAERGEESVLYETRYR